MRIKETQLEKVELQYDPAMMNNSTMINHKSKPTKNFKTQTLLQENHA